MADKKKVTTSEKEPLQAQQKDSISAESVAAKAVAPVVQAADAVVKPVKKPRKASVSAEAAATVSKTPAKSAKKSSVSAKVIIELTDKSASADSLVERAKEDWVAKGNTTDDIKELALYVNVTESMVYYVVNDDYLSGSFSF